MTTRQHSPIRRCARSQPFVADRDQARRATFDTTGQFLDIGHRIEIRSDAEGQLVGIAQHGNACPELKRDRRNRQQVHNVSPMIRNGCREVMKVEVAARRSAELYWVARNGGGGRLINVAGCYVTGLAKRQSLSVA